MEHNRLFPSPYSQSHNMHIRQRSHKICSCEVPGSRLRAQVLLCSDRSPLLMFPSASPPPLTAACWMSSDWNCYVVSITNHWRIRFVLTNWQSFSMQYSFMILFTSKMNFLNFFEWSTKGVTQDSQQIVNKYEQTQGVKNRKAWDEWTSQEITSQKHDAWQITWHWRTAGTWDSNG